jgi:Zn-dependent peptidase ImmA (M78 family)/DNA-binding XRE family transcriptional regulator
MPSGGSSGPRAFATAIGSQIRAARDSACLTQQQLADRLGRTRPAISMWEAGERMPGLEDLLAIGDALERPTEFFVRGVSHAREQAAAGSLRAVASKLSGTNIGPEFTRAISEAEEMALPPETFRPRSRDPIEAAQELLSKMEVAAPPIEVDEATAACGVRLVRHEFSNDALSGFLLHVDSGPLIGVNGWHAEPRQRFTVAHELGHLLLGHHADFHLDLSSSVMAGEPPGYDWRHERAANSFAANLLMPAGLVRRDRVEGHMTPSKLAARYRVSEEAMGIRLSTLGL